MTKSRHLAAAGGPHGVVGIALVLVGNEAARLVGWTLAVLGALGVGGRRGIARRPGPAATARARGGPRRLRRPRGRGLVVRAANPRWPGRHANQLAHETIREQTGPEPRCSRGCSRYAPRQRRDERVQGGTALGRPPSLTTWSMPGEHRQHTTWAIRSRHVAAAGPPGPCQRGRWFQRTGSPITQAGSYRPPGPSYVRGHRPCPLRARNIGSKGSPTVNSGRPAAYLGAPARISVHRPAWTRLPSS